MKNVLIIGSTGQSGSRNEMKLRSIEKRRKKVGGYIKMATPSG